MNTKVNYLLTRNILLCNTKINVLINDISSKPLYVHCVILWFSMFVFNIVLFTTDMASGIIVTIGSVISGIKKMVMCIDGH